MLLSNQKIEYSSVRRVPNVKLTGQNSTGTTAGTPTSSSMPTSTSLQDISSHAQKFSWNANNDNNNNNNNNANNNKKDQRLGPYPETLLRTKPSRQLTTSQSDERIFEHPEVTIKPSALDDELQRRLLNMRISNTTSNLVEPDERQSTPNILEHPDMRTPVVMQSQQTSSSTSSSALLIQNDCKRVGRTQSADAYTTTPRTSSPAEHVEFFIDNQSNPKRSLSPGSGIADIVENSEQEKNEDFSTFPKPPPPSTTTEFTDYYLKPRSKSDDNRLNINDS